MPEGFLNPEEILKQIQLNKLMVAADFGCGSGSWSLPLAQILSDGRVFAVDLIEGPLSALTGSAKLKNITNIRTMTADVEKGTKILSGSCDLVLTTNLLFQCENKKAVFEEAKRVLKDGGKILFVDWKKSASFGPRERAVLPEMIKEIAKEAGFRVEKEFDAGTYHYGLILVK